jgi:hypothetical protein
MMILESIRQKYTVIGKIVQDYKSGNRGIDEISDLSLRGYFSDG